MHPSGIDSYVCKWLVGQQAKGPAIAHTYGAEMPPVQRDDEVGPEAFRQHGDRSVGATEGKVAVTLDQAGY